MNSLTVSKSLNSSFHDNIRAKYFTIFKNVAKDQTFIYCIINMKEARLSDKCV